jgi:hypothetical protein
MQFLIFLRHFFKYNIFPDGIILKYLSMHTRARAGEAMSPYLNEDDTHTRAPMITLEELRCKDGIRISSASRLTLFFHALKLSLSGNRT